MITVSFSSFILQCRARSCDPSMTSMTWQYYCLGMLNKYSTRFTMQHAMEQDKRECISQMRVLLRQYLLLQAWSEFQLSVALILHQKYFRASKRTLLLFLQRWPVSLVSLYKVCIQTHRAICSDYPNCNIPHMPMVRGCLHQLQWEFDVCQHRTDCIKLVTHGQQSVKFQIMELEYFMQVEGFSFRLYQQQNKERGTLSPAVAIVALE